MRLSFFILLLSISISCFSQADTLTCHVYGCSQNISDWYSTGWYINNNLQEYLSCGDPTGDPKIHVAVVDAINCKSWGTYNCDFSSGPCDSCNMVNSDHQFGNLNNGCDYCRSRIEKYFIFQQNDPVSMAYLDSMLTNPLLNGQNLLMYSFNCIDFDYLNLTYPNTIQIWQNLGFTSVSAIDSMRPFIFFTEVGNTSSAVEVYGSTNADVLITLSVPLTNCATNGLSENDVDFKIYPTILRNGDFINLIYDKIEIYDVNGNRVLQSDFPSEKYQVSNLVPGIYILKTKRGNAIFNQKIVMIE